MYIELTILRSQDERPPLILRKLNNRGIASRCIGDQHVTPFKANAYARDIIGTVAALPETQVRSLGRLLCI